MMQQQIQQQPPRGNSRHSASGYWAGWRIEKREIPPALASCHLAIALGSTAGDGLGMGINYNYGKASGFAMADAARNH
jgi:hypothetical protein